MKQGLAVVERGKEKGGEEIRGTNTDTENEGHHVGLCRVNEEKWDNLGLSLHFPYLCHRVSSLYLLFSLPRCN